MNHAWFGTDQAAAPLEGQLEVTIIGPSYGESICIHVGSGRWLIIDSCLLPGRRDAAPVNYLRSIGVDLADQVDLVVATHWHDDHCGGLAETLRQCRRARFCVSSALTNREFLELIAYYQSSTVGVVGSRTTEFSDVLKLVGTEMAQRPTSRKASQGKQLYTFEPTESDRGSSCRVTALSPSDLAEHDFIQRIIGLFPRKGEAKRPVPDVQPNDASVVLWVELGERNLLLGADLEQVSDRRKGWSAVLLADNCPRGTASVFKVPHHGSKNGHSGEVWERKLDHNPIAIVTPWWRGGRALPSDLDVERLSTLTATALITSRPKHQRSTRRNPAVEKQLREARMTVRSLPTAFGAVRLRTAPGNPASPWCIEFSGTAEPL